MPLNQGQELNNRYRIVSLIGQGGFGAVYRAWDLNLKRPCAVKENLDTSAEAQKQFDQEMQLLANLHHSNLVRIYDFFFLPGQGQYMVMDFIDGQDLQTMLVAQGPLPEADVVAWVQQICDALSYMHSQTPPVIHRDIKPANIIITSQGRAMLVDFGISKVYDPHLKTTVGARAVTPGFSPWEQYGQGSTDHRSDIYALGATLYTLLTGQELPESIALMGGAATRTPPRQLNPKISPHVARAIETALQTRPTDRFTTAKDLAQRLLSVPPVPSRPQPQPQSQPQPQPLSVSTPPPKKKTSNSSAAGWAWAGVLLGLSAIILLYQFVSGNLGIIPISNPTPIPTPIPTPNPTPTQSLSVAPLPPLQAQLSNAWLRPVDEMVMVFVPPPDESFALGSGVMAPLEAYWIDTHPVTNAQYQLCVDAGACSPSDFADDSRFSGDDYPVAGVSWFDARDYVGWLNETMPDEAEWLYALPDEAMWEYAAVGDSGWEYPWGNEFDGTLLNFCDTNCPNEWKDDNWADGYRYTSPVGSYPDGASWVGALDMAGNVWEWTDSWYGESETGRVVRGGSWGLDSYYVRAAYRFQSLPDFRFSNLGFRVVLVLRSPSHLDH